MQKKENAKERGEENNLKKRKKETVPTRGIECDYCRTYKKKKREERKCLLSKIHICLIYSHLNRNHALNPRKTQLFAFLIGKN